MLKNNSKSICFLVDNNFPLGNGMYGDRDYEVEVCDDLNIPYLVFEANIWDMEIPIPSKEDAKQRLSKHRLIEHNGATIYGSEILPRIWCGYDLAIYKILKRYNSNPPVEEQEIRNLDNWPNFVLSEFKKRKIEIILARDLFKRTKEFEICGNVFVKTKEKSKGYGRVSDVEEVMFAIQNGLPVSYHFNSPEISSHIGIQPTTELIISEPVEINRDSKGNLEYRVWVANGEIAVTKRHADGLESIPPEVHKFAEDFVIEHSNIFADYYVLDVALSKNKGPFTIEIGSLFSSGWSGSSHQVKDIFKKILDKFFEGD